jgi:hypothetical protein
MPRNYNQAPTGGTTTTGKAYEPMVTPDHRDGDDTSVIGGRNAGTDRDVHGQYGDDSDHAGTQTGTPAPAAPRTAAERELDDITRYEEDGRKNDTDKTHGHKAKAKP